MVRIIVALTEAQHQELMRIVNSGKSESRLVIRARIALDAADGVPASESARRLSVSRPMVVKWRRRFRDMGMDGLRDAPRSGQPVRDGDEVERMVLAMLDECELPEILTLKTVPLPDTPQPLMKQSISS